MRHESSPVIISFYTLDTPYEQEVLHLIDSCKQFSLPHHIKGVPSLGSWERNCAYKPTFILNTLNQLKKPVLWVDADAVFMKAPDFTLFSDCDCALRINPKVPEDHPERIYSGTVFVNYTPHGLTLIEQWQTECQNRHHIAPLFLQLFGRDSYFWDHIALTDVLAKNKEAIIKNIPIAYCKIFDGDTNVEAVIEHRQASRRFKHEIF
jgi:hypothetical protein